MGNKNFTNLRNANQCLQVTFLPSFISKPRAHNIYSSPTSFFFCFSCFLAASHISRGSFAALSTTANNRACMPSLSAKRKRGSCKKGALASAWMLSYFCGTHRGDTLQTLSSPCDLCTVLTCLQCFEGCLITSDETAEVSYQCKIFPKEQKCSIQIFQKFTTKSYSWKKKKKNKRSG